MAIAASPTPDDRQRRHDEAIQKAKHDQLMDELMRMDALIVGIVAALNGGSDVEIVDRDGIKAKAFANAKEPT